MFLNVVSIFYMHKFVCFSCEIVLIAFILFQVTGPQYTKESLPLLVDIDGMEKQFAFFLVLWQWPISLKQVLKLGAAWCSLMHLKRKMTMCLKSKLWRECQPSCSRTNSDEMPSLLKIMLLPHSIYLLLISLKEVELQPWR